MKSFLLFIWIILTGISLQAQNEGPVQMTGWQVNNYFKARPKQKIVIETDKTRYKPGENIWCRVLLMDGSNLPDTLRASDLLIKMLDTSGNVIFQKLFSPEHGTLACNFKIPEDLPGGTCFLCATTSLTRTPQDVAFEVIQIFSLQEKSWIATTTLKDSISIVGKQNEIKVSIKDLTGKPQKNATVRYQLKNGIDILENGKLKTDANGKLQIPFTIPAKTNSGPFVFEISDNKEDWKKEIYLPTSLDSLVVRFFPEGGNLVTGTISKVGFTAFNKFGIPVDIDGILLNQDGQFVTPVRTMIRGLGLFLPDNREGQRYKMILNGSDHPNQVFDLPPLKTSGVALSVSRSDSVFITTNLVFSDKQRHSVSLLMTNGMALNWAAKVDINAAGQVKIPVNELSQGINLLSVMSGDGSILAERIVYVDKKQELKISVQPEKTNLLPGEKMKIKVRLSDEKGKSVAGNITISVADQLWKGQKSSITERMLLESELETPYSLISGAMKGTFTNSTLLDIFLLSNHLKGFDWSKIKSFDAAEEKNFNRDLNLMSDKKFNEQFADFLKNYVRIYDLMVNNVDPDPAYVSANEMLFHKQSGTLKANTIALDMQRRMFESASSILEVIKSIKSYKIMNNMIVFYGSENSFNNQGGALIVMDGQQLGTDIGAIASISPHDVDHINISTNPMDIQKYTGLNSVGVIEIFMKNAKSKDKEPETGNNYKDLLSGQFPADPASPKNDFRTTLQWIPDQKVDSRGEFEFTVTAGKVLSDFIIEVQGIDKNGRPGRGEAQFTVKSK